MPPNNRLAPPLRNSLASYVPAPLDPNMMPPEVSPRFGVGDYAQNLSIGVGEGLTSRLKSAKQTLQDPVQAVKETAMAIRQMYDDPMLALQALRQLRQQIMSGPLGAGQAIGEMAPISIRGAPVMQELDVYHGTPHRFPATEANPLGEFDASKIGTGEGAQAYGHGIYFAESPDVAKTYQYQKKRMGAFATASGEGITVNGKPLDSYGIMVQPEFVDAAKTGNLVEAINGRKNQLLNFVKKEEAEIKNQEAKFATRKKPPKPYELAAIERQKLMIEGFAKKELQNLDRVIKDAEKGGVSYEGGASLYKADLPDEMIDRMLDYDKPLKEQPANVQKFFSAIYKPDDYLVDWLKQGDADDVAKGLQEAGIPGIKYADAGSRGQGGKGTRNFVVFPGEEKKVRILERK